MVKYSRVPRKGEKTATALGQTHSLNVGLTGSLASGKSTTLKVFQKSGWMTASADEIVAKIYKQKGLAKESILKKYGGSKAGLKKLEAWVHPLVKERLLAIAKKARRLNRPLCVEVPLLFEAQFDRYFDLTIFVYAAKADRLKRVRKRGMNLKLFRFLDSLQWPARKKMKAVDFVLRNTTKSALKRAALKLIKKIEAS